MRWCVCTRARMDVWMHAREHFRCWECAWLHIRVLVVCVSMHEYVHMRVVVRVIYGGVSKHGRHVPKRV
jgi:hypothetical protein